MISGSLLQRHGHVLRLRMEERPPLWRVAENVLNKTVAVGRQGVALQSGGLRKMETILHRKNWPCYETDACTSGLDRSFGAT
jgi:hypothetical protein